MTGDYGATSTQGKILDYQTSGYFGIAGWREHPIFLCPTLGRVEQLGGTVLNLTARGTTDNYYHFLYDAIARYGILEEALPAQKVDAVIVPHERRYQQQLLTLAGIPGPYVQPRRGVTFAVERLLVPSTPNHELDAPRWAVEWLRKRLPATAVGHREPRLYLSRGQQPNTRRYVQEPQLWPELKKRGFLKLDPGSLPVQRQIDIFKHAEVVVSPHGAALTNVTFCNPGTKVLEMFAPSYVHLGLWNICEAIGGIEYRYLVGAAAGRSHGGMAGVLDDVSIPVADVLAMVDQLINCE